MRIFLITFCSFAFTMSTAQQPTLRFFEAAESTPVNYRSEPNLVGKVGSNFMVMDNALLKTKIYLFDSSFQLVKQAEQLDVVYSAKKNIVGDKVKIVWNEHHTDEEWLCLLTLDENGDKVDFRKFEYSNPGRLRLKITSDIQNRYYLFSFIGLDDSLHAAINGILLDSSWNKIKTISSPFEYDATLERGTVPVVDALGNIHVFVYDKLSNYRLSTGIKINTIPLKESSIRKQNFRLDKVKLYDPYFFDDPQRKQIQLRDFYYDGATKNKEGLAIIGFPYDGNGAINKKLTPIPDSVLNSLYKQTKNLKKRQSIMESIVTTGVFGNQGASLFQTELIDLPTHQLVRDAEVEPEERKGKRSMYSYNGPYDDGVHPMSGPTIGSNVERWLEDSRVMNATLTPGSQRNVVNTNGGPVLNRLPSFSSNIGTPPATPVSSPSESPFAYTELPLGPEKKVVFFVNDRGSFKWYRYLPPGFPSFNFSALSSGTYPMKINNEWQFLHLDQVAVVSRRNDKGIRMQYNTFSLIRVNDNGLVYNNGSFENEIGTRFFWPILLKNREYVMAYMNGETGKSGLAVLEFNY
jgi:hypothetical protein